MHFRPTLTVQEYAIAVVCAGESGTFRHFSVLEWPSCSLAAVGWSCASCVRCPAVSSADAERAFSNYNKLVCFSRMSMFDESVKILHATAWNGDIFWPLNLKATQKRLWSLRAIINMRMIMIIWLWLWCVASKLKAMGPNSAPLLFVTSLCV